MAIFINAKAVQHHSRDADDARCIIGKDNPANTIVLDDVKFDTIDTSSDNHPNAVNLVKLGGNVATYLPSKVSGLTLTVPMPSPRIWMTFNA
jgi:hypothetical protein